VPAVSEGRDLPLEVTLESPDSSLIDPIGYVEIWDYQMKRAGVVALQGASTAPGDLTVIRLTWPEALSPGYYTARATLQWRSKRLSVSHLLWSPAASLSGARGDSADGDGLQARSIHRVHTVRHGGDAIRVTSGHLGPSALCLRWRSRKAK
jgi:hypothetical protein